jgi:hypothetical protein
MTKKELIRISLMDVYRLMQTQGISKREACERLGFSWPTFMRWQREHPEVIQELQEGQRELLQANFLQLNAAYQEIIDKLVEAAAKAEDVGELLSLESRIRSMIGDAKASGGTRSEQDTNAAKFLEGIKLVPGISKITRTIETINFNEDGSIIEGEVQDLVPSKDQT